MNKKFIFFTMLICLMIVLFISCPTVPPEEEDEEESGLTISGTLYRDDANGMYAYLKLVELGEDYNEDAIYIAKSLIFTGATVQASFSKSGIAAGNYTVWMFIDRNSNAVQSNPLPDNGDNWYTTDLAITTNLSGQDVLTGEWSTFSGYIVSGTLTCAGAGGTNAYLKLVVQGGAYDAAAIYETETEFSGNTAAYAATGIATGNYTAWIFVDLDGNANSSNPLPDSGDKYYTIDLAPFSGNTTVFVSAWATY